MSETTIGGYEVLGTLGDSKRFRAFRASRRTPEGERRGTLYLMTDEVRHPDLFIETVDTIRAAWPFPIESDRDYVLPKAQLWTGRPWFFLPEKLPVASSGRLGGRAAFASLRAQLRWLEQFHPPGGEPHFAHGDVRKQRIALFDAEHPLLIAPGWVAASDLARGKSLSHVRGDDAWHLGKLWIQETDHSFVPDGMESDAEELARRLPRARLPQRSHEVAAAPREAARANGNGAREAHANGLREANGNGLRDKSARANGLRDNGARENGLRDNGLRDNGLRENGPREATPLRDAAGTPPPGRIAAVKREGAGAAAPPPAPRVARPVRETPPARESAPLREVPPVREVAARDTGSREGLPREAGAGAPPPAPARAPGATPPPGRVAAMHRESAPAQTGTRPTYGTPPAAPAAPLRTPSPPLAAVPSIGGAPPRETPGRLRAVPPGPPPAAFEGPSAHDALPADLGPPPAPEPVRSSEPVRSYHESTRAPTERALPVPLPLQPPPQAPASLTPSAPRASAPAPKKRGMQLTIFLVLLVLAVVFVVALTMLKR